MNLNAVEFANEPADKLFINQYIYAQIQKKQELESKHGQRKY